MTDRDKSLALLERIANACERLVAVAEKRQTTRTAGAPAPRRQDVASDHDLDGPHGNPEVRFDPRDWSGDSCKGLRFKDCPAAFLTVLADVLDDFAAKEDDEKKAKYKRLDAARARGWAKRNEGKPQAGTSSGSTGGDAGEWGRGGFG